MSQPNNPAGRLLAICNFFNSQDRKVTVRQAWSSYLDVDSKDTAYLLKRVSYALPLIKQVALEIEKRDVDHELFLAWQKPLNDAFSGLNFHQSVDSIKTHLKSDVIARLEFCNHELSRNSSEKTINKEDLEALHQEITGLIDLVQSSDLDNYLKEYIVEKLLLMDDAILSYVFLGSKAIVSVVDDITGSRIRYLIQNGEDIPNKSELTNRFWLIHSKVADLATNAGAAFKMLESVGKLIS